MVTACTIVFSALKTPAAIMHLICLRVNSGLTFSFIAMICGCFAIFACCFGASLVQLYGCKVESWFFPEMSEVMRLSKILLVALLLLP